MLAAFLLCLAGNGPLDPSSLAIRDLRSELIQALEAQEETLAAGELSWTRERRAGAVMEVFPGLVHGPDFFAPVHIRTAWDGPRLRFDFEASHARPDAEGEDAFVPSDTSLAFHGAWQYRLTELDGEQTLTIEDPFEEIDPNPAAPLYGPNLLYACGWRLPRHAEDGTTTSFASDLLRRLAEGAALEAVGGLLVLEHEEGAEGGSLVRFTLDPKRGFAVLERELAVHGKRVERILFSQHASTGGENPARLPRLAEREVHQWYGLPPEPAPQVLFTDVFEASEPATGAVDPAEFALDGVRVGAMVFDHTLPGVEDTDDGHVLYVWPATEAELDEALDAVAWEPPTSSRAWLLGLGVGALLALAFGGTRAGATR